METFLRTLAISLVFVLSGCVSGAAIQASDVKVADASQVAGCRYLDSVVGTSSWYGLFAEAGFENARLSAFDKARKLGATHVTWEGAAFAGHGSSNVAAKAWKCG